MLYKNLMGNMWILGDYLNVMLFRYDETSKPVLFDDTHTHKMLNNEMKIKIINILLI